MVADAEDKKVLDLVREHDKDVADLIEQTLSTANVSFPIANVGELAKALGGPNQKVNVGGKDIPIAAAIAKIPGYYFPIEDEHELVAKLADAALQNRGSAKATAGTSKLMPATAAKPANAGPPNISDAEWKKARDANPGAGVHGIKRP